MSDDEVGYRRESHHSPRDRDRRSRDHDRDRRDRDRSSYDDRRSRDRGGAGDDRDRSSSYSKRDRHYSDRQEDNDSATKDAESNDNSYGTDDSYYRRPRYSNNNSNNNSSGNNAGKGRWNDSIPNNIILVRGLPDEADENDIINEFARSGVAVKDVRLMRGKDTGLSRRYCFVEFHTVAESQYWMEVHQGVMKLQDKFTLNMYYSTSRRGNINSITVPDASIIDSSMDWICAKVSGEYLTLDCGKCWWGNGKVKFDEGLGFLAKPQVGVDTLA